jgi:hypothetical protein
MGEKCRPRLFENREKRRIYGTKGEEERVERTHNVTFNVLYHSTNIIRVLFGVACRTMGERRGANSFFLWGNRRQRDLVEDSGVDGRIILRSIFR